MQTWCYLWPLIILVFMDFVLFWQLLNLSLQVFWPFQSPLRVAAHKDRLQVPLQQEVHRGRLPNLAPAQPGRKNAKSLQHKALMRRVLTTGSTPCLLPGRVSHVWWDRSRFTWSVGQETTACWEGTTPESCRLSPASAELMILNGKKTAGNLSDGHRVGGGEGLRLPPLSVKQAPH